MKARLAAGAVLALALVAVAGLGSPGAQPAAVAGTVPVSAGAATPPMGWNDWYQDRCGVTETDILTSARQLVSSGLAADGYDTVVVDDCWMASDRSPAGSLVADPATFPDGMAYVAGQVHGLGLKLGLYESAGTKTCAGRPGSYGHYSEDADTFARWGVDFVKLDYCHLPGHVSSAALFAEFGAALRAADPAIVYSQELPAQAGTAPASTTFKTLVADSSATANMWRVTPDEKPTTAASVSITSHLEADLGLSAYVSAGHWNDLDLLLAGNSKFSYSLSEQENQADVWAMESSPLMASGDLTSAASLKVLGNKKIVAIDQQGVQGTLIRQKGKIDVVRKPGAIMLVNTSSASARVHFKVPAPLVNVWGSGSTAPTTDGYLNRTLPAGGVLMYAIAPSHRTLSALAEAEQDKAQAEQDKAEQDTAQAEQEAAGR